MASSYEGEIRLVEKLKIKIGEAKKLVSKSSSSPKDTYASVRLDLEEIFRTATHDKTSSPFYGEEFQFDVPRAFRHLSVCICEYDKFSKQSRTIGKVSFKKETLPKYSGRDNWFPLFPVDENDEVQGKIFVELSLAEYLNPESSFGCPIRQFVVKNVKCSDLALTGNACNPYVTISLQAGEHKFETKKSKTRMKTTRPTFDEVFHFTIPATRGSTSTSFNSSLARVAPRLSLGSCRPEDRCTAISVLNHICLHVNVFHEPTGLSSALSTPIFLGTVKIPLGAIDYVKGHQAWYFLQPRNHVFSTLGLNGGDVNGEQHQENNNRQEVGSLRLNFSYSQDHVFSFKIYDKLCSLLMESPYVQPVTASAAEILGHLVSHRTEAIQPLVRVFLHQKQIIPLLKSLSEIEMRKCTKDPTTIFRGNSLATKCMDEFMRIVGKTYLQSTLKMCMEKILREKKPCEIDPGKISDCDSLKGESSGSAPNENFQNLREIADEVLECIVSSSPRCPLLMCQMFSVLKQLAETHFPMRPEVKYSVLSGFVFLRFFAPAILTPNLYELTAEQAGSGTMVERTLKLLSKTVQSLGNHVAASKAVQLRKEDYMSDLIDEVASPERLDKIRGYLEAISTFPVQRERCDEPPMVLREAWMQKKSYEKRRRILSRKGFKWRYFTLTTTELRYSKQKEGKSLCTIPASHILGVKRVDEAGDNGLQALSSSMCMSNVFRVFQPNDRSLLIQARNCVEEKQWVDMLEKVRLANLYRLEKCHPGAFRGGKWDCCESYWEQSRGCAPVSTSDVRLSIDVEREMERVYSLYLEHLEKMEDVLRLVEDSIHDSDDNIDSGMCCSVEDYCDPPVWWSGDPVGYGVRWWEGVDSDLTGGGPGDGKKVLRAVLRRLCSVINELKATHQDYFEEHARRNRLGSLQFPIGDDNYLKMGSVKAGLQTPPGSTHVYKTRSSPA